MHTFIIILACILILIACLTFIGGIFSGNWQSIVLGGFCATVWIVILHDEVRNKPKIENKTIEMKVESRYYINKNDTFLVSSDTIYPI